MTNNLRGWYNFFFNTDIFLSRIYQITTSEKSTRVWTMSLFCNFTFTNSIKTRNTHNNGFNWSGDPVLHPFINLWSPREHIILFFICLWRRRKPAVRVSINLWYSRATLEEAVAGGAEERRRPPLERVETLWEAAFWEALDQLGNRIWGWQLPHLGRFLKGVCLQRGLSAAPRILASFCHSRSLWSSLLRIWKERWYYVFVFSMKLSLNQIKIFCYLLYIDTCTLYTSSSAFLGQYNAAYVYTSKFEFMGDHYEVKQDVVLPALHRDMHVPCPKPSYLSIKQCCATLHFRV